MSIIIVLVMIHSTHNHNVIDWQKTAQCRGGPLITTCNNTTNDTTTTTNNNNNNNHNNNNNNNNNT